MISDENEEIRKRAVQILINIERNKRHRISSNKRRGVYLGTRKKSVRRLIDGGVHSMFIFPNLVNDSRYGNTDEDADEQEEINDSDEIQCL